MNCWSSTRATRACGHCSRKRRRSGNSGWRAGSAGRTSTASRFAPISRTRSACRSSFACGSGNDDRQGEQQSHAALSPALPGDAGEERRSFARWVAWSLLAGCGVMRSKEGASPSQSGNAIERSAEKGPVKLFVRVWPREPRLSDLVEMDVTRRVPARRRDQTAGVRTGRGRLSHSRLQRAAPRGGCGERAPLPLSVGAGARRQAPDPVGVDRIRGQAPEFGTAG